MSKRQGLGIEIHLGTWEVLPIFQFLQQLAGMEEKEMYNVFNMGSGMILVVDPADTYATLEILKAQGEKATVIGVVTDQEGIDIQ